MNDLADAELDDLENALFNFENDETTKTTDNNIHDIKTSNVSVPSITTTFRDIDSSDDDNDNMSLLSKYSEYGKDVKNLIQIKNDEKHNQADTSFVNRSIQKIGTSTANGQSKSFLDRVIPNNIAIKISSSQQSNIIIDPIFGLRIVHPLISSSLLKERMNGRTAIYMNRIRYHVENSDLSKDWVVAGVLVNKSPVKQTQKGAAFSIWKLSDLKGDIKTVSLFLFKTAHKDLWKTNPGTAIAILNPAVLDKRDEKSDEAALSIDNASKVMILGQSKDFGICKSKKKNGDMCTAIVNINSCEYCIYHVKLEYGKASRRSELQSSTAGRGLNELRNKVLGKSEVFYGGQSFTAITAKKNPKLVKEDQKRLLTLSEYYQSPIGTSSEPPYRSRLTETKAPSKKIMTAASVEINIQQRQKDLERLKMLTDTSVLNESISNTEKKEQLNCAATQKEIVTWDNFKNREFSAAKSVPKLSNCTLSIDLNLSIKKSENAKVLARSILKKKPIEKSNPNFIKYRGTETGKKRCIENLDENLNKKRKIDDDLKLKEREIKIKDMIEKNSSHVDLINKHEMEQQNSYFNKLQKKEEMEEKMMNTFKVSCKAVICSQCKYIAFAAATHCKEGKHSLRVIDAEKRFYECQDCGNRTTTLHRIPKISCKNCHSSRWKRSAMLKDKTISSKTNDQLSIRGNEEKFLGNLTKSSNINLLVPE